MKYERTTLALYPGAIISSVQALRVGDWYVHHIPMREIGLTISHRSGLGAVNVYRPTQAVAVLRALQALPPCPVSDDAFRDEAHRTIEQDKPLEYAALRDWLVSVKRTIDDTLHRGHRPIVVIGDEVPS